ncbi:putative nucleotidyltransferase (plasmid) [Piscirickettsia salmonis]|uniref:nucleotidyltransferase domain-containing protein n=1 Tax=Piscirickettsia salmonis TaxID=1238 RepID=UPI0018AD0446|nr:nucleotidyltransferase domain-containing protein [Piscirickettsia salmonis]QGP52446.1 putative nucleotidyltransferase [Piscirickettsia salmonis]
MIDHGISERSMKSLCKIIKNYPSISQVLLYGSRAKGTYYPHSDIDLCLVGEISFLNLSRIKADFIDSDIPLEVDLCVYSEITNEALKRSIDLDGIQLYGEQNG